MAEKIKLSVVMASMNEENAITVMVAEIRKHTKEFDTEILIVDSSTDKTAEIASSLGVTVIKQPPQGHGLALRAAIQAASHDIVITADCDNTYPMDFIPLLLGKIIKDKYDIVSCNRLTRNLGKEMPAMNFFGNWLFAFLVRILYGLNVHDVTTGMFAMKKEVAKAIDWETNYSFPCELILRSNRNGFRHIEVDIPYRTRIGEVTLNKWRSGKAYIRCILKYRFNIKINPRYL